MRSPTTGRETEALINATNALKQNISAFKKMKEEVQKIMAHCSKDTAAVYKELNTWTKEWRKEEVKKAPLKIKEIIPFVVEITRSGSYDQEKRSRAAEKVIKRMEPFYRGQMEKKLDAFSLCKLLNQLKAWPKTARVLGVDEDECRRAAATQKAK